MGEEVGEGFALRRVGAEVVGDEPREGEEETIEGGEAGAEPVDGRQHLGHAHAAIAVAVEEGGHGVFAPREGGGAGEDDPAGAVEVRQPLHVGPPEQGGLRGAGGAEEGVAVHGRPQRSVAQKSAMRRRPSVMLASEQA